MARGARSLLAIIKNSSERSIVSRLGNAGVDAREHRHRETKPPIKTDRSPVRYRPRILFLARALLVSLPQQPQKADHVVRFERAGELSRDPQKNAGLCPTSPAERVDSIRPNHPSPRRQMRRFRQRQDRAARIRSGKRLDGPFSVVSHRFEQTLCPFARSVKTSRRTASWCPGWVFLWPSEPPLPRRSRIDRMCPNFERCRFDQPTPAQQKKLPSRPA